MGSSDHLVHRSKPGRHLCFVISTANFVATPPERLMKCSRVALVVCIGMSGQIPFSSNEERIANVPSNPFLPLALSSYSTSSTPSETLPSQQRLRCDPLQAASNQEHDRQHLNRRFPK
jgi:hypothetical protein